MGFSLSAATAIIGLSILISIELIVSTSIPTVTNIHDSYEEMRDRSIDRLQTDINITDINTSPNGSNYDLTFVVGNKGATSLKLEYFTVLINGNLSSYTSSKTYLYPENTAEFSVLNIDGGVNERLKVITNNGISEYTNFVVP